jgi:transposase-like protein
MTTSKKSESLSAIARRTGVTPATLRAWRKSGVDLHNAVELAAKIANKQPSAPTESGTDMQRAKLRKLLAEAQLAEMKAAQVDGKLIGLEDLTTCLTKIGSVLKAQLGKMRAEMPVMLYGLSQAEMTRAIGEATDRVLTDICDQLEQIKIDPPRGE